MVVPGGGLEVAGDNGGWEKRRESRVEALPGSSSSSSELESSLYTTFRERAEWAWRRPLLLSERESVSWSLGGWLDSRARFSTRGRSHSAAGVASVRRCLDSGRAGCVSRCTSSVEVITGTKAAMSSGAYSPLTLKCSRRKVHRRRRVVLVLLQHCRWRELQHSIVAVDLRFVVLGGGYFLERLPRRRGNRTAAHRSRVARRRRHKHRATLSNRGRRFW